MPERTGVRALKFVTADLVGDLFYFPFWWYTRGFVKTLRATGRRLAGAWLSLGIGVWTKNILVPMFGQRDIPGRLISFFVRLFQIIARAIAYLFMIALNLALVLIYLAIPIFILVMILMTFLVLFR